MIPRLWLSCLLVCGLFIAEDPTIVAVRTRLTGSTTTRVAVDLGLAAAMVAYNFACSRYVVSVSSASRTLEAMAAVDAQRAERIDRIRSRPLRTLRRAVAHLNPFDLIKLAGDRLGRSVDRLGASARRRRLQGAAVVFEELGAVNMLGVPGAGLALSTSGHEVSRIQSLRHCGLFVGSWFVGAHLVEWFVGRAHSLPLLGPAAATATEAIGTTFHLLTDVTRPVGAIAVVAVTAAVLRYAAQVEHTLRSTTWHPDAHPSRRTTWTSDEPS